MIGKLINFLKRQKVAIGFIINFGFIYLTAQFMNYYVSFKILNSIFHYIMKVKWISFLIHSSFFTIFFGHIFTTYI